MRVLAAILTGLFLPQLVSANCETLSSSARKCFDNTNAPPEIVFQMLASSVFNSSVDYLEDLSQIGEEPGHAGWHLVKEGLTSRMSSADVVRYLVRKQIEMIDEVHEVQQRALCANGVPRYEGAENAIIWNQLDEIGQNVFQKHYYLARSDLQASGLYDLDKVLSDYPGGFTMTYMDHSLDRWGSVDRLNEAAKMFCSSPGGIQVSQ